MLKIITPRSIIERILQKAINTIEIGSDEIINQVVSALELKDEDIYIPREASKDREEEEYAWELGLYLDEHLQTFLKEKWAPEIAELLLKSAAKAGYQTV